MFTSLRAHDAAAVRIIQLQLQVLDLQFTEMLLRLTRLAEGSEQLAQSYAAAWRLSSTGRT